MSDEEGATQMVLPKGRLVLDVFVPINLSKDFAFKPVSISPDIWYGVTDDVTVGLVHSGLAFTGFMGEVGTALCITGEDNGCGKIYDNVGVEGRYKLKNGPLAYAVTAGVEALALDPDIFLDLKVGLVGRWHKDKLSVEFAPAVAIAVTNRTVDDAMGNSITTNRDVLAIPVTGFYAVAPKVAVSLQTGLLLPFEDAGDLYRVPLSLGGHYSVNESLDVTLAFSFPQLIAGSNGGADARSLTLGGTYAF